MLMYQTLSKGWCHARSRLLLGLIVRVGGRLVEAQALFGAAESWTSGLAYRPRGHHPGHPRPVVAPLQKRARFLALRSRTSAPLLPYPLFPEPTQPQDALCGARFARLPACSDPNALWRFGDLPCPGHHSHPGHREGKSFSQAAVFCEQATFGRSASKTEWVYGFKVALSVSPEGVIFAFGLAEAASDERPIGEFLIIEDSHDAYLWPTRALRAFSGSDAGLRTLSWRS
jgi:hypothetical protein